MDERAGAREPRVACRRAAARRQVRGQGPGGLQLALAHLLDGCPGGVGRAQRASAQGLPGCHVLRARPARAQALAAVHALRPAGPQAGWSGLALLRRSERHGGGDQRRVQVPHPVGPAREASGHPGWLDAEALDLRWRAGPRAGQGELRGRGQGCRPRQGLRDRVGTPTPSLHKPTNQSTPTSHGTGCFSF